MSIARLRRMAPALLLIVGLMATALSCGGAAEQALAPAAPPAASDLAVEEVRSSRPAAQMPAQPQAAPTAAASGGVAAPS